MSQNSLYWVTVTYRVAVAAPHNELAKRYTLSSMTEIAEYDSPVLKAEKVRSLPKDWRDAYPWGPDSNETCESILEQTKKKKGKKR